MLAYRQTLGGYTVSRPTSAAAWWPKLQEGVQALLQHGGPRRRGNRRRGLGAQGFGDRETNKLVAERKRELKLLDDEFKVVNKDQP